VKSEQANQTENIFCVYIDQGPHSYYLVSFEDLKSSWCRIRPVLGQLI